MEKIPREFHSRGPLQDGGGQELHGGSPGASANAVSGTVLPSASDALVIGTSGGATV